MNEQFLNRNAISLDSVRVASPCRADWDAMTGNNQVRHCGSCAKNVYNLSEMTRAQAESVVLEHEGKLCVRFYQREDGTMLTQDCPVGMAKLRRDAMKPFAWLAAGAAGLAAWGASLFGGNAQANPQHTMGDVAIARTMGAIAVVPTPTPTPATPPMMGDIGPEMGFSAPKMGESAPEMGEAAPVQCPPKSATMGAPLMGKPMMPHTMGQMKMPAKTRSAKTRPATAHPLKRLTKRIARHGAARRASRHKK